MTAAEILRRDVPVEFAFADIAPADLMIVKAPTRTVVVYPLERASV
jgi:hypothetical protein